MGLFRRAFRHPVRNLRRFGVAAASTYVFTIRPWHMTWGATQTEADRNLPGDEIIPEPRYETTRAITVAGSPEEAWAQLGDLAPSEPSGEEGSRLHRWLGLELPLARAGAPTELAEGQLIPVDPRRPEEGLLVETADPPDVLVLRGTDVPNRPMSGYPVPTDERVKGWADWSWAFVLEPVDSHMTRVIVRRRMDWSGVGTGTLVHTLFEPVHFVREHRLLKTLKHRVEQGPKEPGEDREILLKPTVTRDGR